MHLHTITAQSGIEAAKTVVDLNIANGFSYGAMDCLQEGLESRSSFFALLPS
jgi:hypothetical protein